MEKIITMSQQVTVWHPHEKKTILVDRKLKQLLELLWWHNCSTILSCEENSIAWIQFTDQDARHFLQLAHRIDNQDLIDRINNGAWAYECIPENIKMKECCYDENGEVSGVKEVCSADYFLRISIRFPVEDIEILLDGLRLKKSRMCQM
jgi:hypothetical protein